MMLRPVFLFLIYTKVSVSWIINDIDNKALAKNLLVYYNDETEDIDGDQQGKFTLIYPGTKWCGAGSIAQDYDDLGPEKEADMCCREHDYCPEVITGGGTKYNLTNKAFYTRLSCECDEKFLKCLKAAQTRTARDIGFIYFNLLGTQCFREDFPVIECRKHGGWFNTKCLKYAYDINGEKYYQWFDVSVY